MSMTVAHRAPAFGQGCGQVTPTVVAMIIMCLYPGGDYDLLPRVSDPLGHMLAGLSTQMLIDHRHHWTSPILPHTRLRYATPHPTL